MEQLVTATLQNGLPVVFIPHVDYKTYNFFFLVGTGFRFEEKAQMGITRFLANSLFYKTGNLPDQDALYEKMDALGIAARTEVSAEYTFFNFNILPEFLDESVEVFAEILAGPLFDENNVIQEAKITTEEISQIGGNLQQKIFDRVNQLIFTDHPLGFYSMGTPETVKAITKEHLVNFYQKNYVSGNSLLIVSGPDNTGQNLEKKLNETFGRLLQGERQQFVPLDFSKVNPGSESMGGSGRVAHFVSSWLCYPRSAEERTGQALLNAILSYGRLNPFLGNLRKDKVVYSINSLINLYSDCGVFSIMGSTENYQFKQAQDRILGMIEDLKRQRVSEDILMRAKSLYKSRLVTLMESSLEEALFRATRIFFNVAEDNIEDVFREIDRVTPEDIGKVAQTIFYPNGMFSVTAAGEGF